MQEYRFKFYLNAMHSILINGLMGEVHPHTWEIVVDVFKQNNKFIAFTEVEKPVDELLRPFQNKNMNDISPFDAINPTLENVAVFLQNKFETMFVENGFIMSRIEVSETPSRSFVIDINNYEEEEGANEPIEVPADFDIIERETDRLIKQKLTVNEPTKFEYSYKRFANRREKRKSVIKKIVFAVTLVIFGALTVYYFINRA